MKVYPSKISNAISIRLSRHFVLALIAFLMLKLFGVYLNFEIIVYIIFGYGLYLYLILGITNNDIIIKNNQIIFRRTLIGFRRKSSFDLKSVSKITFKHDWTDTLIRDFKPYLIRFIVVDFIISMILPPDYKWVELINEGKKYKFYCFGLEHDYYDNDGPIFEELFLDLGKRGLNVTWTNTEDSYYKWLMNKVKNEDAST